MECPICKSQNVQTIQKAFEDTNDTKFKPPVKPLVGLPRAVGQIIGGILLILLFLISTFMLVFSMYQNMLVLDSLKVWIVFILACFVLFGTISWGISNLKRGINLFSPSFVKQEEAEYQEQLALWESQYFCRACNNLFYPVEESEEEVAAEISEGNKQAPAT